MSTENPIFVFIDGPAPTAEDRALFAEVRADQFLNRNLCEGAAVLKHDFAAAVDSTWIPKGYRTESATEEVAPPAPPANPDVPPAPPAPPAGGLGVQADDTPPVATVGVPLPSFGGKKA